MVLFLINLLWVEKKTKYNSYVEEKYTALLIFCLRGKKLQACVVWYNVGFNIWETSVKEVKGWFVWIRAITFMRATTPIPFYKKV